MRSSMVAQGLSEAWTAQRNAWTKLSALSPSRSARKASDLQSIANPARRIRPLGCTFLFRPSPVQTSMVARPTHALGPVFRTPRKTNIDPLVVRTVCGGFVNPVQPAQQAKKQGPEGP